MADSKRLSESMDVAQIEGLPGAQMVMRGLNDAQTGVASAEALLLAVAPTRLASLGLEVRVLSDQPEHALYRRLHEDDLPDPYARYNSMLRELGSFMEALGSRRRLAKTRATEAALAPNSG